MSVETERVVFAQVERRDLSRIVGELDLRIRSFDRPGDRREVGSGLNHGVERLLGRASLRSVELLGRDQNPARLALFGREQLAHIARELVSVRQPDAARQELLSKLGGALVSMLGLLR